MKRVKLLKHFAGFQLRAVRFKEIVAEVVNIESYAKVEEGKIFLMDAQFEQFYTNANSLDIFIGAIPRKEDECEFVVKDVVVNGNTHESVSVIVESNVTSSYATKDGELYYREESNEIYVPFNLTTMDDASKEALLEDILKEIQTGFIDEIQYKDSWMHTGKRDRLSERIIAYLKRDLDEQIRNKERRAKEIMEYIADAKERLVRYTREQGFNVKELDALKSGNVEGVDKFIGGLDSIANNPFVKDVKVLADKVTIFTKQIVTRARVNNRDQFYDMGDMEIEINIKNADVRFKGEKKNQSHWSRRDPHPHVDGSSGRACLGNIETTIAELCSQLEIYPLFLTALDFLQNANTSDSAGKNVVNWERVNEDGTPWVDEEALKKQAEAEAKRIAKLKAEAERLKALEAKLIEEDKLLAEGGAKVATGIFESKVYKKEEAEEIATYVAYENYIGYVHNDFLELAESILTEGGNI